MTDASTAPRLSSHQTRRKEQILTQPEPTKIRRISDAIVLKQGSLFLLTDENGDVPWGLPHGEGLFDEDCRFLDGYTLTINGQPPTVLSSSGARGFKTYHELANPELPGLDGEPSIPMNTVAIRRERLARSGAVHELLRVRNYGRGPACVQIVLRFRARFEDIFILKGFVQDPRGTLRGPQVLQDDTVELRYDGHDGYQRTTTIRFEPAPHQLEPACASFTWELTPGREQRVAITFTPSEHREEVHRRRPARPGPAPGELSRWVERADAIWLDQAADVRTSNPLFDRVIQRALLDLRLLRSRLGRLHYFAAGVPWFATLFGRDSATVAIQTLPFGPGMACETLRLLARYQATEVDAYRDAEPGKILHEFRTGELAQCGAIPQSPAYYGTVDATLLFLILLAEYVSWSGDLETARGLRPNVEAALGWINSYADHDGDGYLDYVGEHPNGLVNQGWKDAGNAIVNADGSLADPPIALCEVQAYVYRAWRQLAGVLRALDEGDRADELVARADELRRRFDRDFWRDELGCYALALQKGGRPADVVASNNGQVLWGGIAPPERAARVAERLMAPDMFSGWGIRTLSNEAAAYNPMSYHLGSIWPHDNGLAIVGLRRYGLDEPALRVFDALFEAAVGFRDNRLPELYCGYTRREGEEMPVSYPVACIPQAWAAGAIPHALWNLLGLRANAPEGRLRIMRPRLPSWLDWVELRRLRVGRAALDLRLERSGPDGAVVARWKDDGQVHVEQTEDLSPPDRFD